MNLRSAITLFAKVILLTLLYLVLTLVSGALLSFGLPQPPADQMSAVFVGVLLTVIVNVLVTVLVIRQAWWHGWRLALALVFSLYGITTIMTTLEAIYFAPALGFTYGEVLAMSPGMLLPPLLTLLIYMPLAVLILGRWPAAVMASEHPQRAVMPPKQWAIKLVAIALIYYVIYFSFGYFVAWSNPELQAMYGAGADNQLLMVWGVIPMQIFRGMLWVLFALPVIRMSTVKPWQLALLVGLCYSLPMSIGLIIPNQLMPDASARFSHAIEITTSNFLFGILVVWLFHRAHKSLLDLFGLDHASAKSQKSRLGTAS